MPPLNWIDGTDLNLWANRLDAQSRLPQLLRRFIHATVKQPLRVRFPAGEGVQLGGWDGILAVSEGNSFVPNGSSVWELGTNRSVKRKADDDYQKRCDDPQGVNPAESTFIFVTPRRWGGKDEWIREKNSDDIWAEVRAYDADDLEQWLEQAPAVHAWLARLLGKFPEGAQDLNSFWDECQNSTSPSMSVELIQAGREKEVDRVKTWLGEGASSLVIQADSREEAVAFFAATLFSIAEEERVTYLSRCVIVGDENSWRHLVATHESLILIPDFDDFKGFGSAVSRGHHILIPIGREICSSPEALQLPRLDRKGFEQALISIGVPEKRARNLTWETKRSFPVVRRLLAVNPEVHTPAWAKPEAGGLLVPILLAGAWDESQEADCKAVEAIARRPYAEVLEILRRWSNESDSPVRRTGNVWQLTCREDSWHLLCRFIGRNDLAAFENVAISVLGTSDPRYELPPDERYAAAVYGKVLPHSHWLRKGLAETLALLATRSDAFNKQYERTAQEWVNHIVYRLLNSAKTWQMWASLCGLLLTLAEAAPETFIDAVENALSGRDPFLVGVFCEGGPVGSSSPHTGLLWALETLAWEPKYLVRTALLLAKLTRLDPGGKVANRPKNSLLEIFQCWYPQTPASLDQRLRVIDTLMKQEPDVIWNLLCNLLPTGHGGTARLTRRPDWREWSANWSPRVTVTEYWRSVEEITDRVLANVGTSGKKWCDVIKHLDNLPPKLRNKVIKKLNALVSNPVNPEDQVEIWNSLCSLVHEHRKYADAKWAMPKSVVKKLYSLCKKFEPENLFERYINLFSSRTQLPELAARDWQTEENLLDKARTQAIDKIYSDGDLSTILELARSIDRPRQLGLAAGKHNKAVRFESQLLNLTLGQEQEAIRELGIGFVIGRFSISGWYWAEKVLTSDTSSSWSDQQRTDFMTGLPFRSRTWGLLGICGDDVACLYWRQVRNYWGCEDADLEQAAQSLFTANRPYAAMELASHHLTLKKEEVPSSISASLLADILEKATFTNPELERPKPPLNSLDYEVEQIMKVLDESGAVEEERIARLEWIYLPILRHTSRQTRLLYRELARNPDFFAEVVCYVFRSENEELDSPTEPSEKVATLIKVSYELLESWCQVPGMSEEGTINLEQLRSWVTQAREACQKSGRGVIGDQKIGKALAYAPVASDGSWPDIPIREIIEEVASKDIERGIDIGVFNKRGVWSKSMDEGGRQEREIAAKYRDYAAASEDTWPRTAALLREIADGYEADAHREDIRSELRD